MKSDKSAKKVKGVFKTDKRADVLAHAFFNTQGTNSNNTLL